MSKHDIIQNIDEQIEALQEAKEYVERGSMAAAIEHLALTQGALSQAIVDSISLYELGQ